MTLVKSTLLAAAAAFALSGFAATFAPDNAHACFGGRCAECDWYRKQAMNNGRKGNKAESQRYWNLWSDCMKYKID